MLFEGRIFKVIDANNILLSHIGVLQLVIVQDAGTFRAQLRGSGQLEALLWVMRLRPSNYL